MPQNYRNQLLICYGGEIPSTIRQMDKVNIKLAHATSSSTFLCCCRDNNIIPNGLRLKNPCVSQRSKTIIKESEKNLLRDQIQQCRSKKDIFIECIRKTGQFFDL